MTYVGVIVAMPALLVTSTSVPPATASDLRISTRSPFGVPLMMSTFLALATPVMTGWLAGVGMWMVTAVSPVPPVMVSLTPLSVITVWPEPPVKVLVAPNPPIRVLWPS